ncbi:uncharacterized protein TNCV_3556651 [Trichonephila clavipes]|uniref:Uncharacterized protein n=1 Tax=Trichonephila clavipes TaxID=2585209 RepID=A0A8X6WCQ0_TRICX|nr:uncharacterized protein TNCV_3556651 [Trichonephila clavipes]
MVLKANDRRTSCHNEFRDPRSDFVRQCLHGVTLNRRQATSPLVMLVAGKEMWEASDQPKSVLPLNWAATEPNRSVTCMVLKATANDRRHLALCHDEFRGPRSGICRSCGISNNNNNYYALYIDVCLCDELHLVRIHCCL